MKEISDSQKKMKMKIDWNTKEGLISNRLKFKCVFIYFVNKYMFANISKLFQHFYLSLF